MANVNDRYSSGRVTPEQRNKFDPLTVDGAWATPWSGSVDSVENAHDLQAAPTHLLEGGLDDNAEHLSAAPVADRQADAPA